MDAKRSPKWIARFRCLDDFESLRFRIKCLLRDRDDGISVGKDQVRTHSYKKTYSVCQCAALTRRESKENRRRYKYPVHHRRANASESGCKIKGPERRTSQLGRPLEHGNDSTLAS